jgi:hypothetical protein
MAHYDEALDSTSHTREARFAPVATYAVFDRQVTALNSYSQAIASEGQNAALRDRYL